MTLVMSRDTLCDLCERVIPGDEVEDHRCPDCGGIICSEHSGEPYGTHDPEDHISPDDPDEYEEPTDDL